MCIVCFKVVDSLALSSSLMLRSNLKLRRLQNIRSASALILVTDISRTVNLETRSVTIKTYNLVVHLCGEIAFHLHKQLASFIPISIWIPDDRKKRIYFDLFTRKYVGYINSYFMSVIPVSRRSTITSV